MNTIGYDGAGGHTPTSGGGYGYSENLRTQDFSGYAGGPAGVIGHTNRNASGGGLTPAPAYRQTTYSQRDVEEARGSLTLLKKRMNSRERAQ